MGQGGGLLPAPLPVIPRSHLGRLALRPELAELYPQKHPCETDPRPGRGPVPKAREQRTKSASSAASPPSHPPPPALPAGVGHLLRAGAGRAQQLLASCLTHEKTGCQEGRHLSKGRLRGPRAPAGVQRGGLASHGAEPGPARDQPRSRTAFPSPSTQPELPQPGLLGHSSEVRGPRRGAAGSARAAPKVWRAPRAPRCPEGPTSQAEGPRGCCSWANRRPGHLVGDEDRDEVSRRCLGLPGVQGPRYLSPQWRSAPPRTASRTDCVAIAPGAQQAAHTSCPGRTRGSPSSRPAHWLWVPAAPAGGLCAPREAAAATEKLQEKTWALGPPEGHGPQSSSWTRTGRLTAWQGPPARPLPLDQGPGRPGRAPSPDQQAQVSGADKPWAPEPPPEERVREGARGQAGLSVPVSVPPRSLSPSLVFLPPSPSPSLQARPGFYGAA